MFPSKYLKASDLNGKPRKLKIIEANPEILKTLDGREQRKIVLYFDNFQKMLPLNATNFDSVADITNEPDTDNWAGHEIVVYPDRTTMGGKTVDCVRVKPPNATAKASPVANMADDGPPDDGAPPADFDDAMPPY